MNKKKNKRKIAVVTGGRIEFGYSAPVVREIEKRPNMDYEIIVANMHVLESFGNTVEDLRKEGFEIGAEVFNTLDGYNRLTMVKSLGIFLLELPGIIDRMKPDIILVAGDRGEPLIATIVGAHMYIPVAHIQAGEVSGNIDGVTRHAITKFAHIHFASNEDAARRVLKMGEEPFRVFNVGAPQLDDLIYGEFTPAGEIYKKFSLGKNKPILLVIQHPVTEEFDQAEKQMEETLKAVSKFGYSTLIILNNSDAGSVATRRAINRLRRPFMKVFPNLPRRDYAGLLRTTSVLVGNSSSGILEAPSFRLPAVNIGRRQQGRTQGINIINVGYSAAQIEKAVKLALSRQFKEKMKKCVNPYGDGKSAKRIVDILEKIPIDEKLLIKRITY